MASTAGQQRQYTEQERVEALRLYAEHGAGEAAERTGIPRKTISSWAARRGVNRDAPPLMPPGAPPSDLAAQTTDDVLADLYSLRQVLDARVRVAPNGNAAKQWAVSLGVVVDKIAAFEKLPQAERPAVRIAERQAHQLADAMRGLVVALGLDPDEEQVREAMRGSLRLAGASGETGDASIDDEIALLLEGMAAREREKTLREAGDRGLAADVTKLTGLEPDPALPVDELASPAPQKPRTMSPVLSPEDERQVAQARAELENAEAELARLQRTAPSLESTFGRAETAADVNDAIDGWARDW